MKPRLAHSDDLVQICLLAQEFHEHSPWRDAEFDLKQVINFATMLIDNEQSVILLHEEGMIGGSLVPIFFGNDYVLQEHFWFSHRGGRGLLKAFEDWGGRMGAESVLLTSLYYDEIKNKKYQNFYKKLGYDPQEIHYRKDLK